jgi:hypothetical protein
VKKATISLILLALTGGTYQSWPKADPNWSLPLPGHGLSIRAPVTPRSGGAYHVEVWMPKVGSDLHVVEETLPCALNIVLDSGTNREKVLASNRLRSIGEYGWANVVIYVADPRLDLDASDHVVKVSTGDDCAVASLRGGSVTVTRDYDHPTERYLLATFLDIASKVALYVGLIGVAIVVLRLKTTAT